MWPKITISAFISLALLCGCKPSGPPTTHTNSSQFANLNEKVRFLEQYVTFGREYQALDFDINTLDGGGGIPGPSEWDIRIVAMVSTDKLSAWIPTGGQPLSIVPEHEWIKSVPTSIGVSGINEWYRDGGRTVGIDRERGIVVYRRSSIIDPT